MRILHVANDYSGSSVYKHLVSALDENGITQKVYVPLRDPKLISKNKVDFKVENSRLIYRVILNTYTRLNYFFKVKKITSDLISQVKIAEFDIIHAHTWYSDGGVAYDLYKTYKIPYIVTVRNTDINLFFKYFIHLREKALHILLNAQKIIFISPVYKARLFSHLYFMKYLKVLEGKVEVIPNGINKFWLNNLRTENTGLHQPPQLLYIGRFMKNKNVLSIINSVIYLNEIGINCCMNLVGGGEGKYCKEVMKMVNKYADLIKYHGYVEDLELLKALYRESDIFVMPSKAETFGLVYIEAISQNLPVLFSKGEGIDGLFPPVIGESVDPNVENDITCKLKKIITNYGDYKFDPTKLLSPFNWDLVAKRYEGIYDSCLRNNH